eukprot:5765367-Pyramimonas_sp.AAC.1
MREEVTGSAAPDPLRNAGQQPSDLSMRARSYTCRMFPDTTSHSLKYACANPPNKQTKQINKQNK